MKAIATFGVLLPLLAAADPQDLEVEHYESIPQECIATEDPLACLSSHGYVCNRIDGTQLAVAAYRLSCNGNLSNERKHFAQLLFDGVGWVVETQEAYIPDRVREPDRPIEPDLILDAYVRSQIGDDEWSGGGISTFYMGRSIAVHIGNNRRGNAMAMRALCGLIVDEEPDRSARNALQEECENRFLRSIMMTSQPDQKSPFRAAGAQEIRWSEMHTELNSGDSALVLEARYDFSEGHVSCRLLPHCCSRTGSIYLDSCREPTEHEETAVNGCLAEGLKRRSTDYDDCLRSRGVKVRCEEQNDGGRLCY